MDSRIAEPWSSLVEGDEGFIGPSGKLLGLWQTNKIMQHMHGIIACMFVYWANPFEYLLLLFHHDNYTTGSFDTHTV